MFLDTTIAAPETFRRSVSRQHPDCASVRVRSGERSGSFNLHVIRADGSSRYWGCLQAFELSRYGIVIPPMPDSTD